MRVLDLFSGIGGFSLGLERAGMTTVAFCEQNKFCQQVLRKHWPEIPIYDDIRELDGRKYRGIELVCGGFPCQPFSTASSGKRYGEAHDSYLWPQLLRVVSEARPTWGLFENVAGLDSLALEQVVSDLETLGYKVVSMRIPACAVGLSHRRDRIWICAYTDCDGESGSAFNAEMAWRKSDESDPRGVGKNDGVPRRMDRLRALGNAVVPQVVEEIGRAIMLASSTAEEAS